VGKSRAAKIGPRIGVANLAFSLGIIEGLIEVGLGVSDDYTDNAVICISLFQRSGDDSFWVGVSAMFDLHLEVGAKI
jgi:hypothetical protein